MTDLPQAIMFSRVMALNSLSYLPTRNSTHVRSTALPPLCLLEAYEESPPRAGHADDPQCLD